MRLLASDAFDVAEGAGGASAEDADVPPPAALALPAPPEQYNLRERGDGAPPPPPPPPPLALGADGGLHDDFALLVEVYPVSSERQIKELYLEVNKAESVKEIVCLTLRARKHLPRGLPTSRSFLSRSTRPPLCNTRETHA